MHMHTLLASAKAVYIQPLKASGETSRFAVYVLTDDATAPLKILWPEHDGEHYTRNELLLKHQVDYRRSLRTIPCYHFALKGFGYSKTDTLWESLKPLCPDNTPCFNMGWPGDESLGKAPSRVEA